MYVDRPHGLCRSAVAPGVPSPPGLRTPRRRASGLPADVINRAKTGKVAAYAGFVDQPLGRTYVVEHVRLHILGDIAHPRRVAADAVGVPNAGQEAAVRRLRRFQRVIRCFHGRFGLSKCGRSRCSRSRCYRSGPRRGGCSGPACSRSGRGRSGGRRDRSGGGLSIAGCADQGSSGHERLRGHNGLLLFHFGKLNRPNTR